MKRLLTMAAMFLCCMTFTFAQFSGSGNGTEEDPYLIFNENQLAQVSNFLNQEGVVFKLMKDLDLTDWIAENNPRQGWLPIGVKLSPFMGVFLGNNHKIKGLMINRTSTNHVGFFGYASGATIENLTIEGSTIVGKDSVGTFVGSVTQSTITNCHIKMTGNYGIKGGSCVGGFAGYLSGSSCNTFSASVSVTSSGKTGGIIGCVDNGTISDGAFTGTVIGTGDYTGGLLGWATSFSLSNVSAKGPTSGKDYTGGMLGYCATGNLKNCTFEGDLTGTQYVGGVSGSLETTTTSFEACYTKGLITGSGDYVGGIVGISKGACIEKMEDASHFGDIKGKDYVGGLIGAIVSMDVPPQHLCTYELWSSAVSKWTPGGTKLYSKKETIKNGSKVTIPINNCASIGNIEGNDWVGGLIGSDLSSYGYSLIEREETYYNSKYSYLYLFKENVYVEGLQEKRNTITNKNYFGFIISDYSRNSVSSSLTNNFYSGTIQARNYVGGLVGIKGGGELKNNYSYATIFGSKDVGGIVGSTTAQTNLESYSVTTFKSNVENCQIISATNSNVGRIYGSTAGDEYTIIGTLGSSESNRALTQTRVILQGVVQEVDDDFQNGNSIGPSALRLKANYVSWGWDFDNNWNILETESYPYKKYQAAPPIIESNLTSQNMGISGKSLNGGTVYLYYKDRDAVSATCKGNQWTFATEALQSGAQVKVYADVEGMTPSYFSTTFVGYPGSGTEEDPYRIYTSEDLQGASNRGYYKLMNDIDLTSWINENSPTEGWPAIGRNSGEVTHIDGDNHKISGLWVNTKENFNGLFSNFSAGQIKNLTVEVAAGKKVKGGDYTGILIGRNANGKIINCKVKGDVEGTNHTGGIAGLLLSSEISDIVYEGNISSNADSVFAGGLAGQAEDCEVSACKIKSVIELSGKGGKTGGLIGESKNGSIKNAKTQTTLSATGENFYAGGLVGYSETPITLCSSEGTVTALGGSTYAGGLAGYTKAPITLCSSEGTVTASGESTYAGGLVGYTFSPIDNSYSTANTTGTEFSAGLVGYTYSTIDKCYASGDVNGYMYGGGVVGELDGPNARLTNSVACNNTLSLSAQSSWGCRVIGGFKNGAADPDESNLALSTMQVSLNGVAQKKTDDIVEGKATAPEVLKEKKTYEQLGWDFSKIWKSEEGTNYPVLQMDDSNLEPEPEPEPDPEPVPSNDEIISAPEITVASGNTSNFTINLTNKATDLTAYQFDLILPIGITLAINEKGKYQVSKADRYDDGSQTLNVSKVESNTNTYRIVCFSLSNERITGTNGAILNAVLAVDKNIVDGYYEGRISNIVFTKTDGKQLKLADARFGIAITNMIMGDANGDGEVNVSDIVEIVNYIMGKPSANFVLAAADLNGDGEINVTDIVKVVSIIMSTNNNSASVRAAVTEMADNDRLILSVDDDNAFSLCLDNEGQYVASQFDLRLKDGQKLESISLNDNRSDGHMITYAKTGENIYRVLTFSQDNRPFNGNSGELFTFKVSGNGSIEVSNILFVTSGEKEKMFPSLYEEGTTGIDIVNASDAMDVYSIDGRMIKNQVSTKNGLKKGLYIINGKKVVKK